MPQYPLGTGPAAALGGQSIEVEPNLITPEINAARPNESYLGGIRNLAFAAYRMPHVDDPNYKPPISFWDDFTQGGYGAGGAANAGKFCDTADEGEWLATNVTTTVTILDAPNGLPGGWLHFGTGGAQNDRCNAQLNGESFQMMAGCPLYFEARFAIDDAVGAAMTSGDVFIGLAISDTDITGGFPADYIGFRHHSAAATQVLAIAAESAAAATAVNIGAIANATAGAGAIFANAVRVGMYWDGGGAGADNPGNVYFFHNGVLGHTLTLTSGAGVQEIPDDVCMSPSIVVDADAAAQAMDLYVDYIAVVQRRP